MRKLIVAAALAAFLTPVTTVSVMAQSNPPELSKVDWYRIELVKWKPGKAERAHEIIDMFEKTDPELGFKGVLDFHVSTGEWDSIVAMPMRGGIAQMDWASNPGDKYGMRPLPSMSAEWTRQRRFMRSSIPSWQIGSVISATSTAIDFK